MLGPPPGRQQFRSAAEGLSLSRSRRGRWQLQQPWPAAAGIRVSASQPGSIAQADSDSASYPVTYYT
jgi:hypothetical protein